MTKTNNDIIEELKKEMNAPQSWAITPDNEALLISPKQLFKALSLKQKQQDELLNKFNEKVDEEIKLHDKNYSFHPNDVSKFTIVGLEKSKQLIREVFVK